MRYWLLENSASRGAGRIDWAAELAARGIEVAGRISTPDALREAAMERGDYLLVSGGDGTISRAAEHCLERGLVLGVLPAGTANDLARTLGIPENPAACAIVAEGHWRRIDVARVNGIPLLNAAQIGLGSEVSGRTARRFKQVWGRFSYLRGAFDALRRHRGYRADIIGPVDRMGGRWLNVTVANGRYFGGGVEVAPDARIDDGKLDILAVRARPWYKLMFAAAVRHLGLNYPDALKHRRAPRVRIESRHTHAVSIDGDIRTHTPLDVELSPQALRVLAPAPLADTTLEG